MSDTSNPSTLDTAHPDDRRKRFENAWRSWRQGQEPPRWQQFLPVAGEPCSPDEISMLLHIDIEFRAKAGLPALLTERYFEHPRLQEGDARLDAERQVELIRWEYQQRWQNGDRARRADFEAAFPEHAQTLRDLKPRLRCPRCRKVVVLEETWQTFRCPACHENASPDGRVPPFMPESPIATETSLQFDSRAYQLVEQLGKGGMGEVYRACDPALGRDLAIKVMKVAYHDNAEAERRFLREARVTGSLQHPGIVPVHNLGRLADGRLHYTMRLVRGQTFAALLKDEAGKPERLPYLLTIFEKICQAVAYAHSKRVIHRDLKPANVMVGRFGEVQVMDWGLAKLLTPDDAPDESEEMTDTAGTRIRTESADTPVDLSRTGSGFGTPAYMPPEQALGEWDAVDERADVFALGAILCEILTGQPAYSGVEVLRRARRGDVAAALERLKKRGADAALTALCRECLTPEREGRPRNAGVIAQCVADYQAEVQERLRQAELERVAAETRAKEEQARAVVEQERTREALARATAETERVQEALGRAKAERRAKRRMRALGVALIAGTVISACFAFVAADQKEQAESANGKLAIVNQDLKESNSALEETNKNLKRTADDLKRSRDEAEKVLFAGLLRAIGHERGITEAMTEGTLSRVEVDALTALHILPSDHLRVRFIEEGLQTAENARRLAQRAEWIIHVAVRLDAARRRQVAEVLLRNIRQSGVPKDVRIACILLWTPLEIRDPSFEKIAAELIVAETIRSLNQKDLKDRLMWFNCLQRASESLDVTGDCQLLEILQEMLIKLASNIDSDRMSPILVLRVLKERLEATRGRLDAATAGKVADALVTVMNNTNTRHAAVLMPYLTQALQAVKRHLDDPAADKIAEALVTAMTKTKDPHARSALLQALRALRGPVDAGTVSNIADALVAEMSNPNVFSPDSLFRMSQDLQFVSGNLDAAASADYAHKAADALVARMNKAASEGNVFSRENNLRLMLQALRLVSDCLDADAAGKIADAFLAPMNKPVNLMAMAQRSPVNIPVFSTMSEGLRAISNRLDGPTAGRITDALLMALSKTKNPQIIYLLSWAFQAVNGRLQDAKAGKTADAFAAALLKTIDFAPISSEQHRAIPTVKGHLDDAAAIKTADALMAAMIKTIDPYVLTALSLGLQMVSGSLDTIAAGTYADKATDTLLAALNRVVLSNDISSIDALIQALQTLSSRMEQRTANKVANALQNTMSNNTILGSISPLALSSQAAQALQAVSERLDDAAGIKAIKTLMYSMTRLLYLGRGFGMGSDELIEALQKMCEKRTTPELVDLLGHPLAGGPAQRALLDVLGRRTRRTFRNAWHFLDWARSNGVDLHPPSQTSSNAL